MTSAATTSPTPCQLPKSESASSATLPGHLVATSPYTRALILGFSSVDDRDTFGLWLEQRMRTDIPLIEAMGPSGAIPFGGDVPYLMVSYERRASTAALCAPLTDLPDGTPAPVSVRLLDN